MYIRGASEYARYVKKIPIGPGKSIRSTIWQGNRISNNDATLIIMRLPPYRSATGPGVKEENGCWATNAQGAFLASRNCCRRDSSWELVKYFQETSSTTTIISFSTRYCERIITSRDQCEHSVLLAIA